MILEKRDTGGKSVLIFVLLSMLLDINVVVRLSSSFSFFLS